MDKSKRATTNHTKIILVSLAVMALGYYMLNYLSAEEKPPLGVTFQIIVGCALMAISFFVLVVFVKRKYFPKKKSSRSKHIFLNDTMKKPKDSQNT